MDQTKVAVALIVAVLILSTLILGFNFLSDHWEDIKSLCTIALVVGGTFTLAFGGFKLSSKR